MFKIGDIVEPADGEMGRLIRRVFAKVPVTFPVEVENVSLTGGVKCRGDSGHRNSLCFKLHDRPGPW